MKSILLKPLAPVLLLAAALDFYQIDRTSLWNDEAFSFFVSYGSLARTLRFIADDTHPPFYYLALSAWLNLGHSVFVIRALSALAMLLATVPVHAAAKRLFNDRVALLASLLFAIAPITIAWAQKARPYPLQSMLVAFAFWGFVTICLDASARNRVIGAGVRTASFSGMGTDLAWLTYAVCAALAMLTQDPAGFFILGCNVGMAWIIFSDLPRNRILLLNWVIAQLLLILIWLTWLPTMLQQFSTHLTAEEIATKHAIFLVTLDQVIGSIEGLFSVGGLWRLSVFFKPLYFVLACFAAIMAVRRTKVAIPLLAPIVVPVAACLAGFFFLHPVFGYALGTCVWLVVPYCMLIAFGLLSIRPTILRWAVVALVLLGNAWGVKNTLQSDTPPLQQVAAVIRANQAPGDGIVLGTERSGRWGLAYYLAPPYGGGLAGLTVDDWGGQQMIRTVAETSALPRVWVVLVDDEKPAVDTDLLRPRMRPAFSQTVGDFHVTRFDACPEASGCP